MTLISVEANRTILRSAKYSKNSGAHERLTTHAEFQFAFINQDSFIEVAQKYSRLI